MAPRLREFLNVFAFSPTSGEGNTFAFTFWDFQTRVAAESRNYLKRNEKSEEKEGVQFLAVRCHFSGEYQMESRGEQRRVNERKSVKKDEKEKRKMRGVESEKESRCTDASPFEQRRARRTLSGRRASVYHFA